MESNFRQQKGNSFFPLPLPTFLLLMQTQSNGIDVNAVVKKAYPKSATLTLNLHI